MTQKNLGTKRRDRWVSRLQPSAVFSRLSLFFLGLLVVGSIGAVVAYAAIQQQEQRQQEFQVGQVQTSLDATITPPNPLKRGIEIQKEVTVKNTGSLSHVVRVMVQPEIRGTTKGEDGVVPVLPSLIGEQLHLNIALGQKKWLAGGDGYYYYTKVLPAGETTEPPLFTTVSLNKELPPLYDEAHVQLKMKVESIQSGKKAYRQAWWGGQTPTGANNPLTAIDTALQEQ